ncbi:MULTISPECIES: inositol monophosphatase family protein [unclassified Sphingomonas]|uniref:inositol monophosphatase family protein n=1 Tax=unclassified Sphingomonas TaxID=196159 RepID=UPI000BCD5680|nr:MAG: histidinol phosphate phosphatase [Sphingomonas sp. 32-62-10]
MRVTQADIDLAHRLADAAGAVIRPYFRAPHGLETKADHSPVTLADREAEAAMRSLIEATFPDDAIIGEEYGTKDGTSGRAWVLDPVDGTRAFVSGRPVFGTLIGLMIEGWPMLGIIDQPILKERWSGVIGKPTLFNGTPATTRACRALEGAALATTSPHAFDEHQADHFVALARAVTGGRMGQGPIYGGDCYNYGCLASGHLDIVVEAGLKIHDFAALVPVVEGAGGRMCDWQGDPLTADSVGEVIAAGDPARIEGIVEALACHGH